VVQNIFVNVNVNNYENWSYLQHKKGDIFMDYSVETFTSSQIFDRFIIRYDYHLKSMVIVVIH